MDAVNSLLKVQCLERHERCTLVVEEGDSCLLVRFVGGDDRFVQCLLRNLFVSALRGSQSTTDTP